MGVYVEKHVFLRAERARKSENCTFPRGKLPKSCFARGTRERNWKIAIFSRAERAEKMDFFALGPIYFCDFFCFLAENDFFLLKRFFFDFFSKKSISLHS